MHILNKEIINIKLCQIHNNIKTYLFMTIDHVWKKLIIIVIAWGKGGSLAGLTCSLSTEREQVLNSLENMQNSMISMIFKRQKFCLMLFYNSCFHNSTQKNFLKKYGNKLIPIQNTKILFLYLPNLVKQFYTKLAIFKILNSR